MRTTNIDCMGVSTEDSGIRNYVGYTPNAHWSNYGFGDRGCLVSEQNWTFFKQVLL